MNPLIEVLIATALIATGPIFGRLGAPLIHPVLFSLIDLITAFTVISIALIITKPKMAKKNSKRVIMTGLYSFALITYFTALSLTTAVTVSFLSQFQLIPTLILAILVLKEKITKNKVLGGIIVLLGGILVIYQESIGLSSGWLFALTSFILFAGFNTVTKGLRDRGLDTKIILFFTSGIGCVTLLSYVLLLGIPFTINLGILFAVLNGLIFDTLGFLLLTHAYNRVELSKAYMLFATNTLFTLIYSIIIFGIDFTAIQLLGGALLIGGNIIANKKLKKIA